MTNAEKFKEVFGYKPRQNVVLVYDRINNQQKDSDMCIAPLRVCAHEKFRCEKCPFNGWWNKEYKGCFEMKEELEDDRK